MKKITILLLLIIALTFVSRSQDTSNIACKADFAWNILETFKSTYPFVYVKFNDQSVGNVVSWTWSLNDSIFSHEQNPISGFPVNRYLNLKCKGKVFPGQMPAELEPGKFHF